jgi:hypothetical protein
MPNIQRHVQLAAQLSQNVEPKLVGTCSIALVGYIIGYSSVNILLFPRFVFACVGWDVVQAMMRMKPADEKKVWYAAPSILPVKCL